MTQSPADSRFYLFASTIDSSEEIPGDFLVPDSLGPPRSGLFLPRDDPDWLGRSSYPPRVLLLLEDEVAVIAHPSSGQPIFRIPLRAIRFVEVGHILLLGWIRLQWDSAEAKFVYNTRTRQPVRRFCERLTEACMPRVARPREAERAWGEPLDRKFCYALSRELGADENVLVRLFLPARKTVRKRRLRSIRSWNGANLVALTSRRALWITDQCGDLYERYGTTSVAAPLASLRGAAWEADGTASRLRVRFEGGTEWRTPASPEYEAAIREFARQVREIAAELSPVLRLPDS